MAVIADELVRTQLIKDSFDQLEQEFEQQGLTHLGSEATREALFSLATLKRTDRLVRQVRETAAPEEAKEQDAALNRSFFTNIMWTYALALLVAGAP